MILICDIEVSKQMSCELILHDQFPLFLEPYDGSVDFKQIHDFDGHLLVLLVFRTCLDSFVL